MRDFRDAKAIARDLRTELAAKGHAISHSESLELIAKALGVANWNTLSAAIQASKGRESPRADEPGSASASQAFSADFTASLHRAVRLANQRRHQYVTLEHLLLSLLDDPDVVAVLEACEADLAALRASLLVHVDTELGVLVTDHDGDAGPTQGLQRVLQRAVLTKQTAGGGAVTGADVLASIYSEPASHAACFLVEQGATRYDVVNVITHGAVWHGEDRAAP